MKMANPYLNFKGTTEAAFNHYRSIFGGDFTEVIRYRDFPGNPMDAPEDKLDAIAHIGLPLGGDNILMGTDVISAEHTGRFVAGNNFFIALEADSEEEARRVHGALAEGGEVSMPLQATEWAKLFGICVDAFGIQWMVSFTGHVG